MDFTIAFTSFDDLPNQKTNADAYKFHILPPQDYTETSEYIALKLERFHANKKSETELNIKINKAAKMLKKLFKKDAICPLLLWRADKDFFVSFILPCEVLVDSLEEEVLSFYFKNFRLNSQIIEIPYTSL